MAAIAGTVRMTDGQPIQDASVMVVAGPTHADIAAITDEFGQYELGELRAGVYTLQVFADGFVSVSGRVPVRERRVTRADITLQAEEVLEMDGEQPIHDEAVETVPEIIRTPRRNPRSRSEGDESMSGSGR